MRPDLDRRRSAGQVVGDAVRLFLAHAPVFFVATLLVVAPVTILVDGVLGGQFADGTDAEAPVLVSLLSFVLTTFVVPALVTALNVRAVQALADGVEPTVGGILRQAVELLPRILPVLLLYTLGVLCGFVLLVLPGIYLGTRWYFNAQAVVVDGERGGDALKASGRLVEGRWWRVFGTLILLGVAAFVVGYVAGGALGLLMGVLTDNGAAYVVVQTIGQTIALSIGALGGTLLFFGLRAERSGTAPAGGFLPPTGTPA